MPPRTATTRSYLDRVAGEPWPLEITVPDVDPATGLVQAAFGAEATPDPLDLTGVHQVITTAAQGGHDGIIVQRGTTADGAGTAILRFVIPAAGVTAFTPTGMPFSVRVWESATSHWTEQVGWVSSVVPSSSLTGLIGGTPPEEPYLATIVVTPNPATVAEGQTVQFTAVGRDQFNAVFDMSALPAGSWASSVPADATINASGLATWVSEGLTQITHTRGGVTSAAVPLTTGAAAGGGVTAWSPVFEHRVRRDGYTAGVATGAWADVNFVVESFSGGSGELLQVDRGRGEYRTHGVVAPTGLLADTDKNSYGVFRSANWDRTVEEVVRDGLQWERFTITAGQVGDELLYCRNLLLPIHILGDRPPKVWTHFQIRGLAGKQYAWQFQANGTTWGGGTITLGATGEITDVFAETEVPASVDFVTAGNLDLQAYISPLGTRTVGDYFSVLNFGVWFGRPGLDADFAFTVPEHKPGTGGETFANEPQVAIPMHPDYGMPCFNGHGIHLGGLRERELDDPLVWGGTWTVAEGATPGPWNGDIPVGTPGRFLYDVTVPASGALSLVGTTTLEQSDPSGVNPGADVIPGSCAGTRAWVMMLVQRDGANPVPATGVLQGEITGDAVYAAPMRQIADGADGNTFLYAAPCFVAADNTATTFGVAVRNTTATPYTMKVAAVWVDRERFMFGVRNAGTFSAWTCPRIWHGTGAPAPGGVVTLRKRFDNMDGAFDPFHCVVFRRDKLGFDPEDLRGVPNVQLKWWDGGPNATSLESFLAELRTDAAGTLFLRLYVQNTGTGAPANQRGLTMEWALPAGVLTAYDWNDVVVKVYDDPNDATLSIGEMLVNGTVFDRTTVSEAVVQSPGALWTTFMIWVSMDRDIDCSLQAHYNTAAFGDDPTVSIAALEAYAGVLNTAGEGSVTWP